MKKLTGAVAVVALALTACGGSLCEQMDDTAKSLPAKVKACPDLASTVTYTAPTEAEMKQCEDNLKNCTESDKQIVNTFIDCVDELPACTPATQEAFSTSFVGCAVPLSNVSDACGASAQSNNETVRMGFEALKNR